MSIQAGTRNQIEPDDDMFQPDEGWWASILAEEEQMKRTGSESVERRHENHFTNLDWEVVKGYHARDEIITLEVQSYNRGGLLVQGCGVQGFVPVSHVVGIPVDHDESERESLLKEFVGKQLGLKVIECDPDLDRLILSERAALAGEGCRKRIFRELSIGDVVEGTVTNVTEFGVFIDLGGVEGLIHVSELSWGRVRHPHDVLSVGQQVKAKVLQISEENERVALSYKQLFHNPWADILEYYQPGETTQATITSITHFGAFARIKEGIEGLIHVSSLKTDVQRKDLDEMLYAGQEVVVEILHIDVNRRRLGLGLLENE